MAASPRLVLVAILSAGLLAGCGEEANGKAAAEAETAVPVQVAPVRPAPEAEDVTAYGIVRPDREAVLSFKIAGLVKSIAVDRGDLVRKGDVLAELDLREIAAESSRAASAVEKAKRDVERLRPLAEKGFASRQTIQDAETALDVATAERARVEFNRSLSRIVAPADGVVLTRLAEPNEIVNPGVPILTVSQGGGGFIMKAGLADRDVARIRIGATAQVAIDAFPGESFTGTVRRISAASEVRTGTFEVEIELAGLPEGTASGFIGQARIEPARAAENAANLAIPATAILEGHGSSANVYVVDEASMTVRPARVQVSHLMGENIIVTGGLKEGDRVVSAGAPYLRPGAKIKVVTDLKAARAAAPETAQP
ncbi:MAG: efflux RND transporter periplasmic adaptor subunit [Parvibaculum sp.]|nr:efflux RND transporter periplasmic adaptor subunit [Parvibaculum sp.]